jgi:transcriptional regulator with XRE-family HTH domain
MGKGKPQVTSTGSMTGNELRAIRDLLGMNQRELGDALGMHEQHISKMERGERPIREVTAMAVRSLVPANATLRKRPKRGN